MPRALLALTVIAATAPAAATAQAAATVPVDTAGATQCTLEGFLTDTDPKGTNLRSAPRADAPVIGHLPPQFKLEGGDVTVGAEFEIVGSKNGWLLIRNADVTPQNEDLKIFPGPAWLSGRLAGFTIGSLELRAAPADDAPVVAKLMGELPDGSGYGADLFKVLQVHSCQGHFAEVTILAAPDIDPHAKPLRGWVGHVCSTQLTTCSPN